MRDTSPPQGYAFGTFAGVFTPSILSIVGVIMYLRFGWVLGELGLPLTLLTVAFGSAITFLTGLAISALATNGRVGSGGAYRLVSRSLGLEAGGAVGLPLFASQAVSVSFYAAGFVEALRPVLAQTWGWAPDPRFLTAGTIVALGVLSAFSASLAMRAQFGIMACIVLSLFSLALGGAPAPAALQPEAAAAPAPGYWAVFAVFFPAVTGILSGVGMSGDLRDPARAIPRGTLAAVLTGWALYTAVPILFALRVPDAAALRGDPMLFAKCARVQSLVLLGMWAATLSSALGCLLAAPRTLQALARDRVVPRAFGRGFGRGGDPLLASLFTLAVALAGAFAGSLDRLAPVLTMINLAVYGTLCLAAALETALGNPSWRPTFRVPAFVLFLGAAACGCTMLLIDAPAALAAMGLVALVHHALSRRALRARWGDVRDGLAASLARLAVRRLARAPEGARARNWRPNLLVFVSDPAGGGAALDLAAALSRNRSLATAAAFLSDRLRTPERAAELRGLLARALDARRLEACVFVAGGADRRAAAEELVRTYGFGPLVPNTLLLDWPAEPGGAVDLAALARLAAARGRNLVGLRAAAGERVGAAGRIDVWWRGGFRNGGFLLALGWLLAAPGERDGRALRLCRICAEGEDPAAAAAGLRGFLAEARVEADVLALPPDGRPAPARIAEASADAALAMLGLPPPPPAPPPEGAPDPYATALAALSSATAPLPRVLFALAAEDIDFRGVFSV